MLKFDDGPAKVADFCRLVGISRQRVTVLRQAGRIAGETLAEWVASYCAELREQAAGRADGGALSLSEERARLAQAQRLRLERQAAIESGRWIETADACEQARRAGMTARDGVLSVPGRVAAELAATDDERAIERILTDALREELTRIAGLGGAKVP